MICGINYINKNTPVITNPNDVHSNEQTKGYQGMKPNSTVAIFLDNRK